MISRISWYRDCHTSTPDNTAHRHGYLYSHNTQTSTQVPPHKPSSYYQQTNFHIPPASSHKSTNSSRPTSLPDTSPRTASSSHRHTRSPSCKSPCTNGWRGWGRRRWRPGKSKCRCRRRCRRSSRGRGRSGCNGCCRWSCL
jgi:hypothetical protein